MHGLFKSLSPAARFGHLEFEGVLSGESSARAELMLETIGQPSVAKAYETLTQDGHAR